jgi:hypothetical protein
MGDVIVRADSVGRTRSAGLVRLTAWPAGGSPSRVGTDSDDTGSRAFYSPESSPRRGSVVGPRVGPGLVLVRAARPRQAGSPSSGRLAWSAAPWSAARSSAAPWSAAPWSARWEAPPFSSATIGSLGGGFAIVPTMRNRLAGSRLGSDHAEPSRVVRWFRLPRTIANRPGRKATLAGTCMACRERAVPPTSRPRPTGPAPPRVPR